MIQREHSNTNYNDTAKKKNIIIKLTVNLLDLVSRINPLFKKDLMYKPTRTLTQPSEPSTNAGYDNILNDYILRVNERIGDIKRYEILEYMGRGAFGQVAKCRELGSNTLVAIKITKRDPFYHQQSLREIKFLKMLNEYGDNKNIILQLHDWFLFRGHQCMVIELLSTNILQFFTLLPERPQLAISHIQCLAKQMLETLSILRALNIVHTDIKPDNILLKRAGDTHHVKLIDFGSARYPNEPLKYPVQSTRYRAPEVILRMQYSFPIDMWSFGCFVAELFLGKGLFPNADEIATLHMMVSLLQCYPSDEMLYSINPLSNSLDTAKEMFHDDLKKYQHSLEAKIKRARSSDVLMINKEPIQHLIDFLRQVLVFEPDRRLTPDKALKHAFIQTDYSRLDEEARVGRKRSFHDTQGTLKPLKSILKKRNPNGFQLR